MAPPTKHPVIDGTKRCTKCGEIRPVEEFPTVDRRGRRATQARCKACKKAYHDQWYRSGGGDRVTRAYQRRRRYGLTAEAWEKLFIFQGRACAICRAADLPTEMHTDHRHDCCGATRACVQCVRGIVCPACNVMIGQIERAVRAGWCDPTGRLAEYLSTPPWARLCDASGGVAEVMGGAPSLPGI